MFGRIPPALSYLEGANWCWDARNTVLVMAGAHNSKKRSWFFLTVFSVRLPCTRGNLCLSCGCPTTSRRVSQNCYIASASLDRNKEHNRFNVTNECDDAVSFESCQRVNAGATLASAWIMVWLPLFVWQLHKLFGCLPRVFVCLFVC